MRFLQFCGLILLGGLVSCSWQSAPTPPPVEPQPLSPVAQFMVANATGATAVIEDETFGGEVRVTLEDAFLSAAGETCKRATLLSAQHEAEIVVICHNGQEGDGLSVTQRFWRTGEDAMQKMTACDAAGAALFENGAALLDGIYYWYDGETWTPDTTGMAAAANLNWVPKVTWPESTGGFTLQQKGDTYTVTFRPSAFPSLIQAQVDALSAEADALRRQGFPEEAAAREAQRDSAARAEYKALRYTIQVEGDRAVNCTTYSKVVQPSVAGLDAAGIEAQQMVTNEITYTWQLTGTDPDQIRAILAEVTADARG